MNEKQSIVLYADIYNVAQRILGDIFESQDKSFDMRALYDCYRSMEVVIGYMGRLAKRYAVLACDTERPFDPHLQTSLDMTSEYSRQFLSDLVSAASSRIISRYWTRRLPFVITLEEYSCGKMQDGTKSLKTNALVFDEAGILGYKQMHYGIDTLIERQMLVSGAVSSHKHMQELHAKLQKYLLENLTVRDLLLVQE